MDGAAGIDSLEPALGVRPVHGGTGSFEAIFKNERLSDSEMKEESNKPRNVKSYLTMYRDKSRGVVHPLP